MGRGRVFGQNLASLKLVRCGPFARIEPGFLWPPETLYPDLK